MSALQIYAKYAIIILVKQGRQEVVIEYTKPRGMGTPA